MSKLKLEVEWGEVEDLVGALADADAAPDAKAARIEAIADFLDAATPAGTLLPPPIGMVVEALDGRAYRALLTWGEKLFHRDPEKVAARKARRARRKAARG